MPNVSVIVGQLPADRELALRILHPILASSGVSEVLVPLSENSDGDNKGYLEQDADRVRLISVPELGSKAQILNNLVAEASADVCLILEHDFFVPTQVIEAAADKLVQVPNRLVELHRRDARERLLDGSARSIFFGSTARNRSEIGHAFLIRRSDFLTLRGFDERPVFSDLLGLDLLTRHRRAGGEIFFSASEDFTAYHCSDLCPLLGPDHLPTSRDSLRVGLEQIGSDRTIYRNLIEWSVPPSLREPLVSVAIATHNRADLLAESIKSVLLQTFQDFEIVVIDDGSEDSVAARQVVESFNDSRIRFFRNEVPQGVSAARNRAANETRCPLTAVHDDDDLMLPNRLELGIQPLSDEVDATYGGWVNFHHESGDLRGFLTKLGFGAELNSFSGQGPGHSTWTLPTKLVQEVRYDERLSASVDHNLATRLSWRGVRWMHVGKFMYLRRVHDRQITALDGQGQKAGHILTLLGNEFTSSVQERENLAEAGKALPFPSIAENKDLFSNFGGYLPDHLVKREIVVVGNVTNSLLLADAPDRSVSILEDRDLNSGRALKETGVIEDVNYDDLVKFRKAGFANWHFASVVRCPSGNSGQSDSAWGHMEPQRDAELRVKERVRRDLQARFKTLRKTFEAQTPSGYLLVESTENVSLDVLIPEGLERNILARRIVSAGEFGYSATIRAFGFSNAHDAMTALKKCITGGAASRWSTIPSIPKSQLATSLRALDEEAEREAISESCDDSGLFEGDDHS